VDFDWFSPEVCRDPQLYDGLVREAAPVVYSPEYDVWATGRHAQIELMMRDWKTFSSTRPAFEEIGQPMILLSDDPPDHQRVRTVISKGMSAAVLRRWQEDFAAEAERLVPRTVWSTGTPTSRRSTCSRCSPTRSGSATPTGRC
jgi:cytochrome P450